MEFERIVEFSPAFDRRHSDPAQNYGIGGVQIRFVLKGPVGAVQFVVSTHWYLPHIQREKRAWQFEFATRYDEIDPQGRHLGYHADSQHPIRDWHSDRPQTADEWLTPSRECSYVPSGRCFYDGSVLAAERLVTVLLEEGGDGVWQELEQYYDSTFNAVVEVKA